MLVSVVYVNTVMHFASKTTTFLEVLLQSKLLIDCNQGEEGACKSCDAPVTVVRRWKSKFPTPGGSYICVCVVNVARKESLTTSSHKIIASHKTDLNFCFPFGCKCGVPLLPNAKLQNYWTQVYP